MFILHKVTGTVARDFRPHVFFLAIRFLNIKLEFENFSLGSDVTLKNIGNWELFKHCSFMVGVVHSYKQTVWKKAQFKRTGTLLKNFWHDYGVSWAGQLELIPSKKFMWDIRPRKTNFCWKPEPLWINFAGSNTALNYLRGYFSNLTSPWIRTRIRTRFKVLFGAPCGVELWKNTLYCPFREKHQCFESSCNGAVTGKIHWSFPRIENFGLCTKPPGKQFAPFTEINYMY